MNCSFTTHQQLHTTKTADADLLSNDINAISYEKLTVENAITDEVKIIPNDAEQKELVRKFRASVGPSSDSEALQYLTFYDWDLDQALANHAVEHMHSGYFDSGSDRDQ